MSENWQKCDPYVCQRGKPDPPNDGEEEIDVDVVQPNEETREEEAEGKVKEGRQCFSYPGNAKLVNAVGKEGTNPRSFMEAVSRLLSETDISTCPLM